MHSELQRGREAPSRYISMVTHCTSTSCLRKCYFEIHIEFGHIESRFPLSIDNLSARRRLARARAFLRSSRQRRIIATSFASTVSSSLSSPFFLSLTPDVSTANPVSSGATAPVKTSVKTVFPPRRRPRSEPPLLCEEATVRALGYLSTTARVENVLRIWYYVVLPGPLVIPFILQSVYPFTGKDPPAAIAYCEVRTAVVKDSDRNLVGYSSRVSPSLSSSLSLPHSLLSFARWTLLPLIYRNVLRY